MILYKRMVIRRYWHKKLHALWGSRPIIWLSGVRRAGKTFLCQSLPASEYFDCELPRVRQRLEDPESFWEGLRRNTVILDEVHRLAEPAQILKIAADHYRDIRVIATGSSTLGASVKFKDTLTGRKESLWLTPMVSQDLSDFGQTALDHRFLHGGLPPFFLADAPPERHFQEWVDSYWAKDVQELFHLEKRASFQKFLELLFARSGGMFEATKYAAACEASRSTITNYLKVLESTYVAIVVRPYSEHRPTEIVAAPKVYAFDTAFVCYFRGWDSLRQEDRGLLWEHLVLNELLACLQSPSVRYWRDKAGHEIDFILRKRKGPVIAVECKWSSKDFDPANLRVFRRHYPDGENFVVTPRIDAPMERKFDGLRVRFLDLNGLVAAVEGMSRELAAQA